LPTVKDIEKVLARFPFPINLTKGNFKELEFIFHKKNTKILYNGINLTNFDFIWLSSYWDSRDLAYAVKLYLDKTKTKTTLAEKSTSKITDQMIFSLNGIPVPDSLFLGEKPIKDSLAQIKKVCGYPLIIKDTKGSRGLDSIYIENEEKLAKKLEQFPAHRKYFFQKYIPNQYDWGILVSNGEVVSGEKSYPEIGEFRNNVCNGAKEIFMNQKDIPNRIKQIAIKANNALGLTWSRSDIIIDKNTKEPYLLETNRMPGITPGTTEVYGAYKFLTSQINFK